MKAKLLRRIRNRYYWYGTDIVNFSELCAECFRDTGETPIKSYADKYWRASLMDVVTYKLESCLQRLIFNIK